MYISTLGAVICFVFAHLIQIARFFEFLLVWNGQPTLSFGDGTDSARRDALSQQSCELLVAKVDKADAFGNAEVGGVHGVPRSALSTRVLGN